MPMLKRESFVKQEPPPDLSPEEDVFYCKTTDEIFRDYEAFFERTILCNSILWSCSVTGRAGLTFQEALDSEERARKVLNAFPEYLKRPILFMACLTHRTRLADINDDVFMYSKDRYFIGEQVEITVNRMRKMGRVEAVLLPPNRNQAKAEPEHSDSDSEPLIRRAAIKPSHLRYQISEKGKTDRLTLGANQVSRKKGIYTRDKSKLFLKQNCEMKDGKWRVKDNIVKRFKLLDAKFADFFAGNAPMFERTLLKAKTSPPEKSKSSSKLNVPEQKPAQKSATKPAQEQPKKSLASQKQKSSSSKLNSVAPKEPIALPKYTVEELMKMREEEAEHRRVAKEEMRKRLEEDKVRRKEERDKERDKRREEKRLQEEFMREWRRPRDDMMCDDLKLLPDPVPINTTLPPHLFGEAIMVLEFLHAFSSVFDLHEHFPNGVTWEMLERGLVETDVGSPLVDIFKFLLQAIFNLQYVEDEETMTQAVDSAFDGLEMSGYDAQMSQLVQAASVSSMVPQQNFGTSLRHLQIDAYTISEVLRLHILGSGARANANNIKFRYQQRGGYISLDDAGLELKRQSPELVKLLATASIFDLGPEDKLKLMTALTNQFLSYAATRDYMEDCYDRSKHSKLELRRLQGAEERRHKDMIMAKVSVNMSDMNDQVSQHRYAHVFVEEDCYDRSKLELRRLQGAEERRHKDMVMAKYRKKFEEKEREKAEQIRLLMEANEALAKDLAKAAETKAAEAKAAETKAAEEKAAKEEIHLAAVKQEENNVLSGEPPSLPPVQITPVKLEPENPVKPAPVPIAPLDPTILSATVSLPQIPAPAPKVPQPLDPEIMELLVTLTGDKKRVNRKKTMANMTTEAALAQIAGIDEEDLIPDDRAFFIERKMELETRHKSEFEEREKQLTEELITSQIASSVITFGRDRLYRRYWMFESLPGLFIEYSPELPEELVTVIPQNPANNKGATDAPVKPIPKKIDGLVNGDVTMKINGVGDDKHNSDKENESLNAAKTKFPILPEFDKDDINADVMIISANLPPVIPEPVIPEPVIDPVVDQITQITSLKQPWAYLDSVEKFDQLLNSLNNRGFRENSLKLALTENKKRIVGRFNGCDTSVVKCENTSLKLPENGMLSEQLELNVRDMLLDIEERIFVGALGKLKIKDRNVWRDAIERGGYDKQSIDEVFDSLLSQCPGEAVSNGGGEEDSQTVRDLACALLQIEQGTESRFIAKPLGIGENITRGRKKNTKDSAENSDEESPKEKSMKTRWEESLLQSTNLSQVSLYLSTLESHILWAKSALHARCRICRRKGDAEHMLLCDGCDRGHHTYCLKPPVKHIPTGDWFCSDCKPRDVYRTPMKGRRKTFTEASETEEESSDESTAADSDDEPLDEEYDDVHTDATEDEGDNHESTCRVCGNGGELVCCDNCPFSYHQMCTDPPLKKIPKGEWLCEVCKPPVTSVKIKVIKPKPKQKKAPGSAKSTPSSSKPNSRHASPALSRPSSRCGTGGKKRAAAATASDSDGEGTPVSSRRLSKSSRLSIENTEDELGRHGKQYASSSRGRGNVALMKQVEDIIGELLKDEEVLPFLKPVSKRLVPDYHQIIENPMDFQSIRNKINRYEYDDHAQLVSDVRLIFTNCMVYNKGNTGIYRAGSRLLKVFDKRVGELSLNGVEDTPSPGPSKRSRRQ